MVAEQPHTSSHADAGDESRVFSGILPCNPIHLTKSLATGGLGIIRAKGFVADDAGQNWVIQIVGERFEITPAKAGEYIAVVCIGRKGALKIGEIGGMLVGDSGGVNPLQHECQRRKSIFAFAPLSHSKKCGCAHEFSIYFSGKHMPS